MSSSPPMTKDWQDWDNGSAADSSVSHRVARLEGLIDQLTSGDVSKLLDSQSQLKIRMDVLEVRTEVLVEQRLDQAATSIAEKAAQALDKLGLGTAVELALSQPMMGDLQWVQALVDTRLQAAREDWKAEFELESKRADSVQELGITLVREFERSIVDIVEKAVAGAQAEACIGSRKLPLKEEADQANRLAMAEDKLEKLCEELDKVQNDAAELASLSTHSTIANDEVERASLLQMSDTVERIGHLSETSQQTHAALQADVTALRTEMRRLVSVDLHAMLSNLQRLQRQSESVQTKVAEALEQNRTALTFEAKVRLQEDTRLEQLIKDKLDKLVATMQEASTVARNTKQPQADAMIRMLSADSSVAGTPSENTIRNEGSPAGMLGDSGGSAILMKPNIDGENWSTGKLSTDTHVSQKGCTQKDEPAKMVEDLRDIMLTYFRSEFQEHVVDTLKKLQPESPVGYPESASPGSPTIAAVNSTRPPGASVQASPQISNRDLSRDASPMQKCRPTRGSSLSLPAFKGNLHALHAPVQAVPVAGETYKTGGSSLTTQVADMVPGGSASARAATPRGSLSARVATPVTARALSPKFQRADIVTPRSSSMSFKAALQASPTPSATGSVSLPMAVPAPQVRHRPESRGASLTVPMMTQAPPESRGSSIVMAAAPETSAPADVALAAFESKRALWEAKTSPRGGLTERRPSPVRSTVPPVFRQASVPTDFKLNLSPTPLPNGALYPSSLPGSVCVNLCNNSTLV
mmetsp:Transcript_10588/g.19515  ORF Transcript_10588/g.19515 Transcript_10588/m.19515 type:complete len:755 (-) Transcript_10588:175-2439(-)